MNRLGLLHPSTLTAKHASESLNLYTALYRQASQIVPDPPIITYALPSSGALVGPYGILLHTPTLGRPALELIQATHSLPGLTPRHREIVALVVAVNERAAFHIYSHSGLALQAGLSQNEIDSLHAGLYSKSFTEADRVVFAIARELCVSSGPLSERAWAEALNVLGQDGALAVVHCTAINRYLTTILRGFDAQVPAPGERVENTRGAYY